MCEKCAALLGDPVVPDSLVRFDKDYYYDDPNLPKIPKREGMNGRYAGVDLKFYGYYYVIPP